MVNLKLDWYFQMHQFDESEEKSVIFLKFAYFVRIQKSSQIRLLIYLESTLDFWIFR